MHITDMPFTERQLSQAINDGLVTYQKHPTAPYRIYCYTPKASYTPGAWDNPAVRYCRGLIVDVPSGNVIARPFPKFFNYGQEGAPEIDPQEIIIVSGKMDGSLGILYHLPDGTPQIATKASFTSEQALWASEKIKGYKFVPRPDLTLLFEIIYPENRIVVDYGAMEELVLIGAVHSSGVILSPYNARFHTAFIGLVTSYASISFQTALSIVQDVNRGVDEWNNEEGFVILDTVQNEMVKLKYDEYVRLHRIRTGMTERKVWEHLKEHGDAVQLREECPDEALPWLDEILREYEGEAAGVLHAGYWASQGLWGEERSEVAKAITNLPKTVQAVVWMLLDKKDPMKYIYKTLRPIGTTRAVRF